MNCPGLAAWMNVMKISYNNLVGNQKEGDILGSLLNSSVSAMQHVPFSVQLYILINF
jgi:hypothetical protein